MKEITFSEKERKFITDIIEKNDSITDYEVLSNTIVNLFQKKFNRSVDYSTMIKHYKNNFNTVKRELSSDTLSITESASN
jgi:hypothetical protein